MSERAQGLHTLKKTKKKKPRINKRCGDTKPKKSPVLSSKIEMSILIAAKKIVVTIKLKVHSTYLHPNTFQILGWNIRNMTTARTKNATGLYEHVHSPPPCSISRRQEHVRHTQRFAIVVIKVKEALYCCCSRSPPKLTARCLNKRRFVP